MILKNSIFVFFLGLSLAGFSQTSTGTQITVTITNIPNDEGKVVVGLYDEATFMQAPALQTKTGKIVDGKAVVIFTDVEPGQYGITSYHDKNGNDKIDMDATGIPQEAYGVSNNPMSFGPPQWSDAKFEVADQPLLIELRF